jgi:hypothetical protein
VENIKECGEYKGMCIIYKNVDNIKCGEYKRMWRI